MLWLTCVEAGSAIVPSMKPILLPLFLVGCVSGPFDAPGVDILPPYTELRAQGMDKYLNVYSPIDSTVDDVGVTSHRFAVETDGPQCLYGGEYNAMTRDQGHDDLVVFLQGGGLCYSDLCLAVTEAPPGMPSIDILNTEAEFNPVRSWNQAYVPYCDGSLFGGDVEIDDDGDGVIDRIQHGLINLSAAMDIAGAEFPDPERILIAGSSGGGYGTMVATVLARWTWPHAEITVFNDAGVGLGIDGDPSFLWDIIDEFNAATIVPQSRHDLLDGGHLMPLIGWQIDQDPNLFVGAFSFTQDYVISQLYLKVDYTSFEMWLREQTDSMHTAHPDRFQYFLPEGVAHTTLLGDPSGFVDEGSGLGDIVKTMLGGMETTSIDQITAADWLEAMVEQTDEWTSLAD